MVNFYHRHFPNYSQIAQPLSSKTGGGTVTWTDACQNAFQTLKEALVNPTFLGFPDFSPEALPLEFIVYAFKLGAEACLSQKKMMYSNQLLTYQQLSVDCRKIIVLQIRHLLLYDEQLNP